MQRHSTTSFGSDRCGCSEQRLRDISPKVRSDAALALGGMGPAARSAVPDLDRALEGADRPFRVSAARALLWIDPTATRPRVIAAMRSLLTDPSIPYDHHTVVLILIQEEGVDATAALLLPLLAHQNAGTRLQAIRELTTYCANAKDLSQGLEGALANDDHGVRWAAALLLLKHEPRLAARAVDTLVEAIAASREDSDYALWYYPLIELRRDSPGSVTRLAESLAGRLGHATKAESRCNVLTVLGELGPEAMPAVPAVLDASKSDDWKVAFKPSMPWSVLTPNRL